MTIEEVHRIFLNAARHVKRGQGRGTTEITVTTGDYDEMLSVLSVLAVLKDEYIARKNGGKVAA